MAEWEVGCREGMFLIQFNITKCIGFVCISFNLCTSHCPVEDGLMFTFSITLNIENTCACL